MSGVDDAAARAPHGTPSSTDPEHRTGPPRRSLSVVLAGQDGSGPGVLGVTHEAIGPSRRCPPMLLNLTYLHYSGTRTALTERYAFAGGHARHEFPSTLMIDADRDSMRSSGGQFPKNFRPPATWSITTCCPERSPPSSIARTTRASPRACA
jgi:hypothetical protein